MITVRPPTDDRLAAMVHRHSTMPLSYARGLLDRVDTEHGWFVDRYHAVVGNGVADFDAACDSLREWAKFRQPWTRPALPLAPIDVGATVGYSARVVGLWWSFSCHIVRVIVDEQSDGTRRFGLVYGTVTGHAERGEEQFLVTLDPATGDVVFSLFAMSRPGRWYTWIGLPLARRAQARFRPGAAAAIRAFVDARRGVHPDPV